MYVPVTGDFAIDPRNVPLAVQANTLVLHFYNSLHSSFSKLAGVGRFSKPSTDGKSTGNSRISGAGG